MNLLRLGFFAGILLIAQLAHCQSNLVLLASQPGDYIGGGETYVTTNATDFSLSGTPSLVTVDAFGFTIQFASTNLSVGPYTNATRYPFNGSGPGLTVYGNGRGCNDVCGNFNILEMHVNSGGQVDRFWLTFTQYCECSSTALTGEIRYNSQLAPVTPVPQTIHVPADYPTIQAAINAANILASDTVLVAPGVYNEAVNFNGKAISLVSAEGPAETIIKPPAGSSAFTFSSGETTNSVVSGFTITNGGISVSSSSPTIISNVLENCGTGVYSYFGSPNVINNLIINNSGDGVDLDGADTALIQGNIIENNGGGIGMDASGSPTVIDNLIQNNEGTAIGMINECDVNIIQNVIANNAGDGINAAVPSGARGPWAINNTIVGNTGNGIWEDGFPGSGEIINNIVSGNPALNISPWYGLAPPTIQFNDFYSADGNIYAGGIVTNLSGIDGNISANPLFACLPDSDFQLLAGSPCIDAGTNGAPDLPTVDFAGNPRILAGNVKGSAIVDMGAYEFNPAMPPTPCLYLNNPSNVVVTATVGQNSAVATYPAPDATPTATVTCLPASGSVFPAGTNIVVCMLVYGTNTLTSTFTVTVLVPPYITNQTSIVSAFANSDATMTVGAIGTAPMNYQWSYDGNAIADATNSTLTISNVQSVNEGYYQVALVNIVGTATSQPIILRVLPSAALIVAGPVSVSVPAGSPAVFSADVVGSAPLTFQWYQNGTLLPDANTAQLVVSNAQVVNDGSYQVQASNFLGTAVSTGATLTVQTAKPSFVLQPVSVAAVAGTNVTFESEAMGSEDDLNPINYAWYFQGKPIPGQNGTDLSLASITLTNQGFYYVVASNLYGAATSEIAQLTVYSPPSLQAGLTNLIVNAGSSILLSTIATGTPPLGYTWNFNYTGFSNTMASLSLTNLTPSQSGFYTITVTNPYGSISSTSRVSVLWPGSQVVAWGDNSGGQTEVPTNLDDAVAIAGGDYHSVALRHNGTLVAWGLDDDGQTDIPSSSLPFVSVVAGADHNLAIADDGSVVAWGLDDAGQTNVPSTVSSALSVAAGDSHSLALLASGTVVAWGDNTYGQTNIPDALMPVYYSTYWWGGGFEEINPNWVPVQAIAAGGNNNLALLTNGTVVAWGDNSFGQASPPANLSNVVAVAMGYLHGAALISNGTVVAWGDDTFGQTNVPPGLTNVVAIAAGDYDTLALLANGTVVGWGDNTFGQMDVPANVTDALGIASGSYHGLALVPFNILLQANLTSSGLVIRWNGPGTLQWAPTPVGPYTDMLFQGNSWTNLDLSAPAKFFRLRQ